MPEGSPGSGSTQTVFPFEAAGAEPTLPSHAELDGAGAFEPASSHQPVAATSNVLDAELLSVQLLTPACKRDLVVGPLALPTPDGVRAFPRLC